MVFVFHNQEVNFSIRLGDFVIHDVTAERCTVFKTMARVQVDVLCGGPNFVPKENE